MPTSKGGFNSISKLLLIHPSSYFYILLSSWQPLFIKWPTLDN